MDSSEESSGHEGFNNTSNIEIISSSNLGKKDDKTKDVVVISNVKKDAKRIDKEKKDNSRNEDL